MVVLLPSVALRCVRRPDKALRTAPPSGNGITIYREKPVHSQWLFLKYGGEGELTSPLAPFGQSPRRLVVCPAGAATSSSPSRPRPFGARVKALFKKKRSGVFVEPRSVVLIPLVWGHIAKARTSVMSSFGIWRRGGHIYVHYQLTNFFGILEDVNNNTRLGICFLNILACEYDELQ